MHKLVRFDLGVVSDALSLAPSPLLARRPVADLAGDMPVESEAPPFGRGAAAGAPRMIRPPHPPPVLTSAQVQATLARSRTDLEACLPPSVSAVRATVRATFSRRGGLALRIQLAPRDPAVSRCLDTAARRWLLPLEGRPIGPTVTATIRVLGGGAVRPPPPNPPVNPPPPNNQYDEGLVHAALDRQHAQILRCLSTASTSTPGEITMRLTVRTEGAMALEGATWPAGVGGGPVLACLSQLVGTTRVPSPPTTRAVTHIVTLGR